MVRDETLAPAQDGDFPKHPVPRVPARELGGEEFYRRFREPGLPVVLEGALEGWPRWTLESMAATIGEDEFVVRVHGEGHFDVPRYRWQRYAEFRPMTFRAYADMVRSGEALRERAYLAQSAIADSPLLDELRPDLATLAARYRLRPLAKQATWNLWTGPVGHTEPLHFDTGDGTLIQLQGEKTVDLFPAARLFDLYPFGWYGALPPWVCEVDITRPDLERFPRLAEGLKHWHRAVLGPGDLLFIPVGWLHEVTGTAGDFVCSLNRFWRPEPRKNHFANSRVGAFYFINKVPWPVALALHGALGFVGKRLFGWGGERA